MPTVVPETDTFPATISRPANGELADSASFLTFVDELGNRTRNLYNRSRGALYDVTRAPYNADPTGAVSSTAAIQAAITDAAVSGGHVFLPPGTFKHGSLTFPGGVSVIGVPDATFLSLDHATANALVFTDYQEGNPATFQDIRFIGNVATTGTCILDNVGMRAQFIRCTWNGFTSGGAPTANLKGKIYDSSDATAEVDFIDCRIGIGGAAINGIETFGKVKIRGGRISCPATYTGTLVWGDTGSELDVETHFDLPHTSGTVTCIYATSSTARIRSRDCTFDYSLGSATAYAVLWIAGSLVDVSAPRFLGSIVRYGSSQALLGSRVALTPTTSIDIGAAPSVTLPTSYASISARSTAASGPTITLPTIIFPGQELRFTLYNNSGFTWGFSLAGYGFKATQPTLSNNTGASAVFVASDPTMTGAVSWVQVGDWATVAP